MTIENIALALYQGEDLAQPFTIYTDDSEATAQNITGWAVSFRVTTKETTTTVLTKTVGGGLALTTPSSGILTLTLLAADTAAIAPGYYDFELSRTNAGAHEVLTTGNLHLKPSRIFAT